MNAIENGIFTKTRKDRLLNLEAKQIKPLELYDVRIFLTTTQEKNTKMGKKKTSSLTRL